MSKEDYPFDPDTIDLILRDIPTFNFVFDYRRATRSELTERQKVVGDWLYKILQDCIAGKVKCFRWHSALEPFYYVAPGANEYDYSICKKEIRPDEEDRLKEDHGMIPR